MASHFSSERIEKYSKENDINYSYPYINDCPMCHTGMQCEPVHDTLTKIVSSNKYRLYCFYICPKCKNGFIVMFSPINEGIYSNSIEFNEPQSVRPLSLESKEFEEEIEQFFPDFVEIYNEAYISEQIGASKICGMGYRKALEFLIKDFLKLKYPDKSDEIDKAHLINCIRDEKYNISPKIKEVAEKCDWLCNDHSHYITKHTDKDLNDLKILLEATIYWVQMELVVDFAKTIEHK